MTLALKPVAIARNSDGSNLHAVTITTPDDHPQRAFRPTTLMERVSSLLEDKPGLSQRSIRSMVKGKDAWKLAALDALIAEGFVERQHRRFPSAAPQRSLMTDRD